MLKFVIGKVVFKEDNNTLKLIILSVIFLFKVTHLPLKNLNRINCVLK